MFESSDLLIRRLRKDDVQRIFEIHMKALSTAMPRHYSSEQMDAWIYGITPEGYWRIANSGENYRVAEVNGAIAGFASWQEGELLALFVDPTMQNQSIGSNLLLFCDNECPLHFVKAVLGATSFYEKHSFEKLGQRSELKRGVQLPYMAMRR